MNFGSVPPRELNNQIFIIDGNVSVFLAIGSAFSIKPTSMTYSAAPLFSVSPWMPPLTLAVSSNFKKLFSIVFWLKQRKLWVLDHEISMKSFSMLQHNIFLIPRWSVRCWTFSGKLSILSSTETGNGAVFHLCQNIILASCQNENSWRRGVRTIFGSNIHFN